MSEGPKILTIASDAPFLDVLAKAIAQGFPLAPQAAKTLYPLSDWTILLPNRRAARELQSLLLQNHSQRGLLLPVIRPIGDVDEDLLDLQEEAPELASAISPLGRQFALLSLIDQWVIDHPELQLAAEIAHSPSQSLALALSLGGLIDSLESEDVSLERLPEAYDFDLALHREAILSLLNVVRQQLPALLHSQGLIGPLHRRNLLIRREAQRLQASPPAGPIIVAGSTGSLPATRNLLKTIAHLPLGSVVLPGLDLGMDEESWDHVSAQHPQYGLKTLLAALDMQRGGVVEMAAAGARGWLLSEIMRPTETADQWHLVLKDSQPKLQAALKGLTCLEARDKAEEAASIALILRAKLEEPEGHCALITPDRDLARRVKAALLRWHIEIDDSAGEPLIRFGAAAYLDLVLDAVLSNFSITTLRAVLHHPLARFGQSPDELRRLTDLADLTLFRSPLLVAGLDGLLPTLHRLREAAAEGEFLPGAFKKLGDQDWSDLTRFCEEVSARLQPLKNLQKQSCQGLLSQLLAVVQATSDDSLWAGPEADGLFTLLGEMADNSHWLADCDFTRLAALLRHAMRTTPLRDMRQSRSRIAILGLLEARLMRPDTVILGGLNENSWPQITDPGPWLNRPMRDLFGMAQPERHIGQTAHDFVQAMGCEKAYVTWSRRVGMDPAIPSRWILRLQTVMQAANLDFKTFMASAAASQDHWTEWATVLDKPPHVRPHHKPVARPPLRLRPRQLSVTRIETLIRDPYAIYAQTVLGLEPLPELAQSLSPALRGTLVHGILGEFYQNRASQDVDELAQLLSIAERHFAPFMAHIEVARFWWPRFVRLARWLLAADHELGHHIARVAAEVKGTLPLIIEGQPFSLTARADRIDIDNEAQAHIIDYKTGRVPGVKEVASSLAPQLTLQAAMLAQGAFEGLGAHDSASLAYIKISGGTPPGEVLPVTLDVMATAEAHLAGLVKLLTSYANPSQAYVPRYAVHNEDEVCAYDHLSRYREWVLADDAGGIS